MSGGSAGFREQQGPFPGGSRQHAGKFWIVSLYELLYQDFFIRKSGTLFHVTMSYDYLK